MTYFKDENGVECLYEDDLDNLFIKNKKGNVFLVNKTREYAEKNKLQVIYETTDGKTIIKPDDSQKRRANKKIRREREREEFMKRMILQGIMIKIKRESENPPVCPICGNQSKNEQKK